MAAGCSSNASKLLAWAASSEQLIEKLTAFTEFESAIRSATGGKSAC
jgi:hypothetical protein